MDSTRDRLQAVATLQSDVAAAQAQHAERNLLTHCVISIQFD